MSTFSPAAASPSHPMRRHLRAAQYEALNWAARSFSRVGDGAGRGEK